MRGATCQRRYLKPWAWGVVGLVLGPCLVRADESWTRRFRIGLAAAVNVKAEFSLGGEFGVSGVNPGLPGVAGQDHTYDDGYVKLDHTGNAGGVTSNWGYQNASQYDAAAGTLSFHGTQSFNHGGSLATVSEEPYYGLDLAYGGRLTHLGKGVLGWEFGFGYLPLKFEDNQTHTVTAERVTHQFDASGIVLPQAPYHGGPDGVGPVIHDVATEVASETATGILSGSRRVDADFLNFRLGPNLQWYLGDRWAASVGGGLAAGLVTGDYSFNERIDYDTGGSAANAGSFSATEWVYGGYAEGMIYFRAEERSEIYVGAQYLGLGDATFSGSGREARLKLGNGLVFVAGFHWIF